MYIDFDSATDPLLVLFLFPTNREHGSRRFAR